MAIKKIVTVPDSILRKKSLVVEKDLVRSRGLGDVY